MKKTAITLLSITMLSGCVTTQEWQANTYHDEFTGKSACRVEMGTPEQRAGNRYSYGTPVTYNFYAENHDGEIRTGIRSEPAIPINGDVQIKVGGTLYTIGAADTPIDTKPSMPSPQGSEAFNQSYAAAMDSIQKVTSPYRAFTGKKARALLENMVSQRGEVIFRTVGVNTATSGTGRFIIDDTFVSALHQCGVIE